MPIDSLHTLLLEHLKDTYDAEKQITKALPKMIKAATSLELKEAFTEHLAVTKTHVARLEEAFALLDEKPKSKSCAAMKGLLQEGQEVSEETSENPFGDAALIAAAQKVEHYEISAYGTACAYAGMLGNEGVVQLLRKTLNEEKEADLKLTDLSAELLGAVVAEDEEEMEHATTVRHAGGKSRS